MKKKILTFVIVAASAAPLAFSASPEWPVEEMTKACTSEIMMHVEKESSVLAKVWFQVNRAGAIRTTDDSFSCLVVGDRMQKLPGGGVKSERRVYSGTIQIGTANKMKSAVVDVPLF